MHRWYSSVSYIAVTTQTDVGPMGADNQLLMNNRRGLLYSPGPLFIARRRAAMDAAAQMRTSDRHTARRGSFLVSVRRAGGTPTVIDGMTAHAAVSGFLAIRHRIGWPDT